MDTHASRRATRRPEKLTRAQAVDLLVQCAALAAPVARAPWEAVGLVAAQDVFAPSGVPECPVSLRDGYAVCAGDTAQATPDQPLRIAALGRLTADARDPAPLTPGRTVRILTGAPLPPGADAVIPFEQLAVRPQEDQDFIFLDAPAQAGTFILPQGGDLPAGCLLARAGERISAQAAAVLTRARVEALDILPRSGFAMFGLGSELAAPATHGDPTRIPADNIVLVTNLLRGWGLDAVRCDVLPDDRTAIAQVLEQTAQGDARPALIVTTGGTGRSERDHARQAAMDADFHPLFQGLDVRPGKNVFAALRSDPGKPDVLLLGLPGPPAAVFACLHGLALPLARHLRGLLPDAGLQAMLAHGLRTRQGSEWLLPCALELKHAQLSATPLHGEEWPSLRALARARAVAVLPPDSDLASGGLVELLCATDDLIGL
ncbi:MAG: molybdopterin-binding protein [Desulfovibrio sp.]